MALPTSGPISFSEISAYLGLGGTNNSLRSMSSVAGFSTPDAVSEFYGYGALVEVQLGYSTKESGEACVISPDIFFSDNYDLMSATILRLDSEGTTPANPGWYSDTNNAREWDGSDFVGFAELCF